MRITSFEEIIAWQKSKTLTLLLYKLFANNRDYAFKDQIQRASVSIMNNIAEGFERHTNAELRNFLYIAKGSSGEVRSLLYLAFELKYLHESDFRTLRDMALEVSRLLSAFIKKI
ncbi:MAG: four helix bundle protein [Candidatus Taylorbacteria bacterium]